MAGPTQEEIQEYFDNRDSFGRGDNGDPTPSFDPFSSGGISNLGPSGSVYRKFKTLKAFLQTFYGTLPEGAVDYNSSDLDGDGVNEVYAVDADGNPHTVYGYDSDGNTESSEFNQWQYDSFLNDIDNVETDQDFINVLNRYTEAGLENNSVIESFSIAAGGPPKTPEDLFKDMLEEAGGNAAVIADIGGILESDGTIRGFFENVDILVRGIFNLPIPDWLRNVLPAIFKLPSVVDIWDNTVGKVLEGVDEGCFGEGEASVSECTGQILGGIGDAAGDLGKTIEEKVTEVYEGVVGAIDNPEDAVQEVYDWITGIFGEDPKNMPPWVWGVVLGGVFGKEILGGLEDIFGDDVNDDGTIGVPPVTGDDFDCSSVGRIQQEGAKIEAECGGCAEGYEPKNGQCVVELDPCPGQQIRNEVSSECEDPDPGFVKDDPCKTESGDSGTYDKDGNCVATFSPPPPVDCTQPKPGYTPSFNPADNAAHFEWEEACGATHCPDGSEKPASGVCGEQPTCDNGAINAPDCNDCGDNTSPDMHEGGDCSKPLTKQQPQPCANGATIESDCLECPEGQEFNAENKCVTTTTGTPPGSLGFSPDCNKPRPIGTVTFDLIEQQRAWDLECGGGGGGSFNCNSLNRSTNEDGSCGECLPGYVLDENMDNCVKQEIPVTTTTPTTETPESASASVGGGGGGAFSPFMAGISYTPQPVPEVIQQPAGMFTGAQPRSNTKAVEQSIVKTLLPEYFA